MAELKIVLNVLREYAEKQSAIHCEKAASFIGVDNHSDVFHQGQMQAYRDMAHQLAMQKD